jgi:hypothetical protein
MKINVQIDIPDKANEPNRLVGSALRGLSNTVYERGLMAVTNRKLENSWPIGDEEKAVRITVNIE